MLSRVVVWCDRARMLDVSRHLLSLLRCHARQERYARLRQPRTDNSQWRDVSRAGDRRCDAADAADQADDAPRGRATSIVHPFKLRFLSLEPRERVPLGSNEPLITMKSRSDNVSTEHPITIMTNLIGEMMI